MTFVRLFFVILLLSGSAWSQDRHWSFRPIRDPEVPAVADGLRVRNPVDSFIRAAQERKGVRPSPEADPAGLARRVWLDVVGLPPTVEELDRYLADEGPGAYERLVDSLLELPAFGEHQARLWCDLARYADTNGYEKDRPRSQWPWRDGVIHAFNADAGFYQFAVEQIAGDLLSEPSLSQRVATGFHRNAMINEEGGIDIEEYRYYAVADRVDVTSTVFLGVTMGCARCHDHKYDPFSQEEYFRLLAFFDNANELAIPVPDPAITGKCEEVDGKIAARIADLEESWPVAATLEPSEFTILSVRSQEGATLSILEDGSVRASGAAPATDVYEVTVEVQGLVDVVELEVLPDSEIPGGGPGRTDHGNFVLSELELIVETPEPGEHRIPFSGASADFSQAGYPVSAAVDGKGKTGWAIHDPPRSCHVRRRATFRLEKPLDAATPTRVTFRLQQRFGSRHTLGRFRFVLGREKLPSGDLAAMRRSALEARLDEWTTEMAARARPWDVAMPLSVMSENGASLDVMDDGSVLASGNAPQTDVYVLEARVASGPVAALRLEALPHESLPKGGPGRSPLYATGDFILSEISVEMGSWDGLLRPVKLASATHSFAHPGRPARDAIDGEMETGWSVLSGVGRAHRAVFVLAQPVASTEDLRLRVTLRQHGIHQMTLGRFRFATTGFADAVAASAMSAEVEAVLAQRPESRSAEDRMRIRRAFLAEAVELAGAWSEIEQLRASRPRHPTTLVLKERPLRHQRRTRFRKRGEYLQPGAVVTPGVPAVLHPFADHLPRNRLGFARWLVSDRNPLLARVVVNRVWAQLFGEGLVPTVDDFGTRGERPSHPDLLDWLATRFRRSGGRVKDLIRLVVTSDTYRQSSSASPESWSEDPHNRVLARGPRHRVSAETVRDIALVTGGLLHRRIGGPSVFPPQPPGVTELSFGAMAWKESEGPDRYRRGLYTFKKRTAPYATFQLFDAPSGEITCPRRQRSTTPLQALALLNDTVHVEAARAFARRVLSRSSASDDRERVVFAFRSCTSRPPEPQEIALCMRFLSRQRGRADDGSFDAKAFAGSAGDAGATVSELAAWTALCRALLNLDETITKS